MVVEREQHGLFKMESLHKFIHGAQPSMTCESPQGPQGSGPAVFFFLGKGIGFVNTPVARSVAMALSRFYINRIGQQGEVEPSFRQASEFDFLPRSIWAGFAIKYNYSKTRDIETVSAGLPCKF